MGNVKNIHDMQIARPTNAGSYGRATISSSATALGSVSPTSGTLTLQSDCGKIALSVESGNIRYRLDGTSPTTTVGGIIYAGTEVYFSPETYAAMEIIRDGSTDAVFNVHQYQ